MAITIFHGFKGSPDSLWLPSVKAGLEQRGHAVAVPALPDPALPDKEKWVPFALKRCTFDSDTVLIGHSSGGALILSILEKLEKPIRRAILVAAFYEPIRYGVKYPILQESYDWQKIRSNCKEFFFVYSDNDPWMIGEHVGRSLVDKLGGTFILVKGAGHFGSTHFNQPYPEFPLLIKMADE